MNLQIRVQTHVTSVLYYQFILLQSGKKRSKDKKQVGYTQSEQFLNLCLVYSGTKLCMTGFPFGNREDQQGQPDETEREKLCCAKGLVKKENPQKQGHRRADVLEEAQHI